MALSAGARLGPYEVLASLGAGGMGEVYRARDIRLKREVAIKVLPEAFSQDPDRLARFQREAEVLATLNHPNIAAVYGFEETPSASGIVLELVEGPTLADRIAGGPVPLDEALAIARQIADALEAAHEKGVIHRDLKPANIKLRPDGTVKVLDFGLAKMLESEHTASSLSMSPTLNVQATYAGVILGTAAYMSPEQARGKPVDRRSDIWAFGCVLYEMLTGRQVFETGETVSDAVAAILTRDPEWTALPADVPAHIRTVLRRCLQKDPQKRLRDISDARIEIDEAESATPINGSIALATRAAPAALRRDRLAWTALVLVTLIAVLAIVWIRQTGPTVPVAPEMRVDINTPPTTDPVSLAISADGLKIVFVASEGGSRLWVRSLDSVSQRPLEGTNGAAYPFWSPDGRSVGFFADGKLKRIDIDGGSVQVLADAPNGFGGSWNRDGVILFSPAPPFPIFRVSATGSEAAALTRVETPQQAGHGFPQFLPDGRHFLYSVRGTPQVSGVYIRQLEGTESRRLLDADSAAVVASSGQLLFVRQGKLFAQNFDPVRLALAGNPFTVAELVVVGLNAALSASAAGPIVYRAGSAGGGQGEFVWIDRSGKEIGRVGDPISAVLSPSFSPDARRVALFRAVSGNTDVWLLEMGRGVLSRFTFDAADDVFPIWSTDGSRIVFSSSRNGKFDLYQKPTAGAGTEELLLATEQRKSPADWSRNGRFLLYESLDPKTNFDIWALPFDGDRKPFPVVQTNFEERDGQFSPDENWIAYQSNESGRFEIYVQPFPGPGGKSQISTNGGAQVRWRGDGKELFYIALDGRLMAVPLRLASNGQAVDAGAPIPLFATRVGGAVQGINKQQYTVSLDGQRFLMLTVPQAATASPITMILNLKIPN